MWMKIGFKPAREYAWAAFGPLQLIWNRPVGGPLLWLTVDPPKLLLGSFWTHEPA